MVTLEERLLKHWEYKIMEHSRHAADHNKLAEAYREVKDFTERAIEDQKRHVPSAGDKA